MSIVCQLGRSVCKWQSLRNPDKTPFDSCLHDCWQGKVSVLNWVLAIKASALTDVIHVTFIRILSAKESHIGRIEYHGAWNCNPTMWPEVEKELEIFDNFNDCHSPSLLSPNIWLTLPSLWNIFYLLYGKAQHERDCFIVSSSYAIRFEVLDFWIMYKGLFTEDHECAVVSLSGLDMAHFEPGMFELMTWVIWWHRVLGEGQDKHNKHFCLGKGKKETYMAITCLQQF